MTSDTIEKYSTDYFHLEVEFFLQEGTSVEDWLRDKEFTFTVFLCDEDVYEDVVGVLDTDRVLFVSKLNRPGVYKYLIRGRDKDRKDFTALLEGTYNILTAPLP